MEPFATNVELVETVADRGHDYRVLGLAPFDGRVEQTLVSVGTAVAEFESHHA